MTVAELLAIAAGTVGLLGLIGGAILRDRQVHKTIDDKVSAVDAKLDGTSKELHSRINRVRDEMVRPSDMQNHTTRVESALHGLQAQIQTLTSHLLGRDKE